MILYFHYTDLTSNLQLGNHDGFSKNLLGFAKILLSSMSYLWGARVFPSGIKLNHTQKDPDENLVFLSYIKV